MRINLVILCLTCIHGNLNAARQHTNYRKQQLSESQERRARLFSETRHLLYSDRMLSPFSGADNVSQACRDDFAQLATDLNRIFPPQYVSRS